MAGQGRTDADGTTPAGAAGIRRWFFLVLGWAAVGLGIIGIALPLLPTTPFLLVAAWAFAKASPRLRRWLHDHPRFGPFLTDWHEQGAIPPRAKVLAVGGLLVSWIVILTTAASPIVPMVAGLGMGAVGTYVVTRPRPARPAAQGAE